MAGFRTAHITTSGNTPTTPQQTDTPPAPAAPQGPTAVTTQSTTGAAVGSDEGKRVTKLAGYSVIGAVVVLWLMGALIFRSPVAVAL
jgi:preprotein translocase subunit SecF